MWKSREALCLYAITAFAAAVRMWHPTDQWLGIDSVFWVRRAFDFLEHGHLALAGQTPGQGSFPVYVAAFGFEIFGRNLEGGFLFFALIAGLSTIPLYWCGTQFFDRKTSLLACFFYALNPYLVSYKAIWPPTLGFFFLPLALGGIGYFLKQEKVQAVPIFLFGVLLGILLQFHLTHFILLLIAFGAFASKRWSRKWILWLSLGVLVGYAPFLLHEVLHRGELIRFVYDNVIKSNPSGYRGPPVSLSVQLGRMISVYFSLFGGWLRSFVNGEGIEFFWPKWFLWLGLEPLLFIIFLIWRRNVLFLAWVLTPFVFHLVFRYAAFPPHYWLILFPTVPLGAAAICTSLIGSERVSLRILGLFCVGSILLHHSVDLFYRLQNHGFGLPTVDQIRLLVDRMAEDCGEKNCSIDFTYLEPLDDMYRYVLEEEKRLGHVPSNFGSGSEVVYLARIENLPGGMGTLHPRQSELVSLIHHKNLHPLFSVGLSSNLVFYKVFKLSQGAW